MRFLLLTLCASFLSCALFLSAAPAAAQPPAAADVNAANVATDYAVPFAITARDIIWWEEEDNGLFTVLVVYLSAEKADALYDLSVNHVGEQMAFYIDGAHVTTFVVPDAMGEGKLTVDYTLTLKDKLKPVLPPLPAQKPRMRVIRTR